MSAREYQPRRRDLLKGAAGLALTAALPWPLAAPAALSARSVAERAAAVDKVPAWSAAMRMEMSAPNSSGRTRAGFVANRLQPEGGNTHRYLRFSEPADLDGTALLIHEHDVKDNDIWLYLPALGRVRRIVSSGLDNSFVGTEFTFGDLMTPKVDRYHHTFLEPDSIDGQPCFVVESVPTTDSWAEDTGYSREIAWIRKDGFVTVRVDYFDLRGERLKSQRLTDFFVPGDFPEKRIARRREMDNVQNGRRTVMAFTDITVGPEVPASLFRPNRLGRR